MEVIAETKKMSKESIEKLEEVQEDEEPSQPLQNVGTLLDHFNQTRVEAASQHHYIKAEQQLENISLVKRNAHDAIFNNMVEKHEGEKDQVDDFNRDEFEEFTVRWD